MLCPPSVRRVLWVLLVPCVALLSACAALGSSPREDGSLRITAPEDGAFLADGEVSVMGTTDLLGATEVRINGRYVPVESGAFETTIELAEGPGRITADLDGYEAAVAVTVDTTDPIVTIESPEIASFSDAPRLHVRGRVDDRNAASLTLNGEEITLGDDGTFDHIWDVAPGAHRIRVEATDRVGRVGYAWSSVLWGDFSGADAPHLDAMVLDVGADALSEMADGVEPFLAPSNLEPALLGANPILDGIWGRLDIEGESHGPADLAFVPREGYLQIALAIPDVRVPLRADLRLVGDITGDITVTRAFVTGRVHVAAAFGLPLVSISNVEVVLEGLLIDVRGLSSWVDENIVTRAARGRLESKIRDMIANEIPARLGEALANLQQLREVELADGQIVIESGLAALSVGRAGLNAAVDIGISATMPDPELSERSLGSFVTGSEIPQLAPDGRVRAAVSVDLVNDALHSAWLIGALSQRFERLQFSERDVNVAGLGLLLRGIGQDLPPESPVQFFIDGALPPVVARSEDGLVAVDLVDLRVAAFAEVGDELVPLFSASVAVHAAIAVNLGDASIGFDVNEFTVVADLIDGPSTVPAGEALDMLLTDLLGPKVEALVSPIDMEIPSLAGFSMNAPAAAYESGYLTFAADLSYVAAE